MKVNQKANKYILEENGATTMQLLGPNYYDTLFNSKHTEEKIDKLGKLLLDNKLYFFPKKYVDAYLDGKINDEELIMGKGVFNWPMDITLGTPDLAIELAFGSDCKKNKSSSAKGKKEEWVYKGKHQKMERDVIAYKFTFIDNKLTSYEDKSDSCYFAPNNFCDFENDDSCTMKEEYVNSRRLFAELSEGMTDGKKPEFKGMTVENFYAIETFADTSVEQVSELFEEDEDLDRHIESFESYDSQGALSMSRIRTSLDKLQEYMGGIQKREVHASEIVHATTVLAHAKAGDESLLESGKGFIDRYKELEELRNNKIVLLNIDELSEWGYKFENSKHEEDYKKIYNLILDDYRKKLPPKTPFHDEYQNFSSEFEIYKEKKSGCFVATATMGDYNHPTVKSLRIFRDDYLDKRKWGSSFIKHYYYWGPYLAKGIEKSNFLKKLSYFIIIKPLAFIASKLIKSLD
tara:strand:- start:3 stop:1385 length:1383 start_codon:yes stop_codon:yes gene_type:complete